ncbi:MAG: aminotransferase class I/II-fold pyridoxal phosphate-dependent enzyme [Gemmatimonadales bacterium]
MSFIPFELERWQGTWEHRVRFNLSESGVYPLSVAELLELAGTDRTDLDDLRLGYSQADGTDELRSIIAELYPGATEGNVLVTVGSSEANFLVCWSLIKAGDRVAALVPMYRQTWGVAQNLGAQVAEFALDPELGWDLNPEDIGRAISPDTKLVVVTNPNNPTGHVLSAPARDTILDCARSAGAWLLADEVYQGAELDGVTTQSFWGSYERTIVVGGLSKAYGLPGLRIGWIVCPRDFKESLHARHDYTVICPPAASDYLARTALGVRDLLLERTRTILNENYAVLADWLGGFGSLMHWRKPDCGAICFVDYRASIAALDLAERIRVENSILLEPGEHFGYPRFLRMGYGNEPGELQRALEHLGPALENLLSD